jgi:Ca2+-binding RTX toxin-like protein
MGGSAPTPNYGRRTPAIAAAFLIALSTTATATHSGTDTLGHTTVEQRVVPAADPQQGYTNLTVGPGEPYVVRDGSSEGNAAIPEAQDGRKGRRVSLAYVSQMTDFQLADEESPARVEFVDPGPSSAWRPQEGFTPFQIEETIRQINQFAHASPVPQGDGSRNAMDFALLTGDQADNQHLNETVWVRDLLEGNGPANFNSGLSNPGDYAPEQLAGLPPSCAAFVLQEGGAGGAAAEGARYTGVQDYDDYPPPESRPVTPLYYDPDEPTGSWAAAGWPEYDGLMDRAQSLTLDPEGLAVPFYITNGNHDILVQGNEDANQAFEDIATGCFKALATTSDPTAQPPPPDGPDPNLLLSPADVGMLVPPDPRRQLVSKPQIKQIYGATAEGPGDDDHGFAHVDQAENAASNGSASYYAWNPTQTPGMRFISIDTNSEGGQTAESFVPGQPDTPGSSNGNLDDPQFQWLKRELRAAWQRNRMVVIFGHHPVRSMNTQVRDEQAAPCTGLPDEHEHDLNPGCDLDPRPSDDDPATPGIGCIHNGTDAQNTTCPAGHESFVELIDRFPNVLAYIPGHTHEHRLTPFIRSDGSNWWEVNTSAVIDPPNQSRLVEFMDNRDGTISIFTTVVDHAGPATAPPDCPDQPNPQGDCAAAFDHHDLASIGRTFSFNDPDNDGTGTGRVIDRNAELLLGDPRRPRCHGRLATIVGTPGDDRGPRRLRGTPRRDVIVGGAGDDAIIGRRGNDLVCAGRGADRIRGGHGNDRLYGRGGGDRLAGHAGSDRLWGGGGKDRLFGGAGADRVRGGRRGDRLDGRRGADRLAGQAGADRLWGRRGKDRVFGGAGADRLSGGRGDDRLRGRRGRDRQNGGPGSDFCDRVRDGNRPRRSCEWPR